MEEGINSFRLVVIISSHDGEALLVDMKHNLNPPILGQTQAIPTTVKERKFALLMRGILSLVIVGLFSSLLGYTMVVQGDENLLGGIGSLFAPLIALILGYWFGICIRMIPKLN